MKRSYNTKIKQKNMFKRILFNKIKRITILYAIGETRFYSCYYIELIVN